MFGILLVSASAPVYVLTTSFSFDTYSAKSTPPADSIVNSTPSTHIVCNNFPSDI
jgi:hypothetical protein